MDTMIVNYARLMADAMAKHFNVSYDRIFTGALEALRSEDSKWIQRFYATDARGEEVSPMGKDACHWCMMGALAEGAAFAKFGPRKGRQSEQFETMEYEWVDWDDSEEDIMVAEARQHLVGFNDAPLRKVGDIEAVLVDAARQARPTKKRV